MTAPAKRGARPHHPAAFKWLPPDQTAALGARIVAAGSGARLEVREDAAGGLHFRVVPGDTTGWAATDEPDLNDSRVCPPVCP